jgi:capsular polysaccharide biosynthesis protein/Mrp family chromosome partitioning ATPase
MDSSGQPGAFEAVDYTGVLRRRWPIVVGGAVVGLVAALAYVTVAPKSYVATAAVYVSSTGADQSSSSSGGKSSGGLVNMNTEAQLVTSGTVATLAGHMMHSPLTAYELAKQIIVVNPPNSSVLDITCTASTATAAATCANDFAAAYLQNRSTSATNALNATIKTLQGHINTLQKSMTKLNQQIAGLAKNSATRLSDLSVLAGYRTQVTSLNGQVVALTGQAANVQGGHVITSATPPSKPKSPSKTIDLPIGLVVGLLLGLVAAFVWDRRDKRLHNAGDVERVLGLPVVLSLSRKAFGRQVSLASPRSRTGRAFTELAHTVAGSLGGDGSHVVLVAGATPGPGTSVVAANLAAALARTRGEAVLVCADLRDSVAPELFGLPGGGRGLAEVAAGLATVGEVVSGPPGLPGLWVIPPGSDISLAEYHLQYDTARALTAQLRRDARFVVIEAQAGDEGADSFALAEFADTAVVTLEVERVRRDEARLAVRRLGRIRVPVLGAAVIPPITGRVSVRPAQPPRPALSQARDAGLADARPHQGELPDGSSGGQSDRPARTRDGRGNPADRVPRR